MPTARLPTESKSHVGGGWVCKTNPHSGIHSLVHPPTSGIPPSGIPTLPLVYSLVYLPPVSTPPHWYAHPTPKRDLGQSIPTPIPPPPPRRDLE